ncbi:MAG: glucose-6-phosphate isomerase [Pseudomonadota bacterium]|uniref:glucose-6-phosphate isomerase n=1 Tax=Thermithiobacillus tepidarius TaxID=929 RepID=UPI000415BB69|nr:glucose-6-phosphate isomerase [Thermithiobacillus tepidarius]
MSIFSRLSINGANFLDTAVGGHGVKESDILAQDARLDGLRERLQAWREGKEPSFLGLPFQTDLAEIKALGNKMLKRFKRFIVFGIGGSSLGGNMLVQTLGDRLERRRVRFYDNVDPITLESLDRIDWNESLLIVISKSGNTAETLAQLLTVLPRMERELGAQCVREHVLVITEEPNGALYQIAERLNVPVVAHPPVGGRFVVLSVVGLLPAYLAGADIEGVMEGARAMAERCCQRGMTENPALWQGTAQYLLAEKGKTISQWMPYSDHLSWVVDWYRQLWAESLGKHDAQGRERGLTPVHAKGVTDQHSQLQLFLQGPADKQFTFLTSPDLLTAGERIPMRFADLPAVRPLVGHTTGELFGAEFLGTRETLTRRGRPNRTLSLLQGDAFAIGELIILLEVETVVVAELMGIDPFDQPAVEESKVLTRKYLDEMKTIRGL